MSCYLQSRGSHKRFSVLGLLTQGQTDLPVGHSWVDQAPLETEPLYVQTMENTEAQWSCPWISGWNSDKREETNLAGGLLRAKEEVDLSTVSKGRGSWWGKGQSWGRTAHCPRPQALTPSPPNYSFLTKMQANSFYLRVRQDNVLKRLYVCS